MLELILHSMMTTRTGFLFFAASRSRPLQWVTGNRKKQMGRAGKNKTERHAKHPGTHKETPGQASLTDKPIFQKNCSKKVNSATDSPDLGHTSGKGRVFLKCPAPNRCARACGP